MTNEKTALQTQPQLAKLLPTLMECKSSIRALAVLPNGNVVSGGDDNGALKVWDITNGQCLQTLVEHTGRVNALAVMPNGNVVSGSDDRRLMIWDITNGQCLQTLVEHRYRVCALGVLPNGDVVSGSDDCTFKVWDITNGQSLQTFADQGMSVTALIALPNRMVVSGDYDGTLKVWNLKKGQCVQSLVGHRGAIWSIAVLPDGKVVSGGNDSKLKIWDVMNGHCLHTLIGHTNSVYALVVLPDGNIMSGSDDGTLKIWDVTNGQCLQTLTGHEYRINALALLPNGNVLSGSNDGGGGYDDTLKVWEVMGLAALQEKLNNLHQAALNAVLAPKLLEQVQQEFKNGNIQTAYKILKAAKQLTDIPTSFNDLAALITQASQQECNQFKFQEQSNAAIAMLKRAMKLIVDPIVQSSLQKNLENVVQAFEAEKHRQQAELNIIMLQFEKAVDSLNKARQLITSPEAFKTTQDELNAAIQRKQQADELHQQGSQAFANGEHEQAINLFKQALALQQHSNQQETTLAALKAVEHEFTAQQLQTIGITLWQEKNYLAAKEAFTAALEQTQQEQLKQEITQQIAKVETEYKAAKLHERAKKQLAAGEYQTADITLAQANQLLENSQAFIDTKNAIDMALSKEQQARSFYEAGINASSENDYDKAMRFFEQALTLQHPLHQQPTIIALQSAKQELAAYELYIKGLANVETENYTQAIKDFNAALQKTKVVKLTKGISDQLDKIANQEKAQILHQRALTLFVNGELCIANDLLQTAKGLIRGIAPNPEFEATQQAINSVLEKKQRAEDLLQQGIAAFNSDQYELAITHCNHALQFLGYNLLDKPTSQQQLILNTLRQAEQAIEVIQLENKAMLSWEKKEFTLAKQLLTSAVNAATQFPIHTKLQKKLECIDCVMKAEKYLTSAELLSQQKEYSSMLIAYWNAKREFQDAADLFPMYQTEVDKLQYFEDWSQIVRKIITQSVDLAIQQCLPKQSEYVINNVDKDSLISMLSNRLHNEQPFLSLPQQTGQQEVLATELTKRIKPLFKYDPAWFPGKANQILIKFENYKPCMLDNALSVLQIAPTESFVLFLNSLLPGNSQEASAPPFSPLPTRPSSPDATPQEISQLHNRLFGSISSPPVKPLYPTIDDELKMQELKGTSYTQ